MKSVIDVVRASVAAGLGMTSRFGPIKRQSAAPDERSLWPAGDMDGHDPSRNGRAASAIAGASSAGDLASHRRGARPGDDNRRIIRRTRKSRDVRRRVSCLRHPFQPIAAASGRAMAV